MGKTAAGAVWLNADLVSPYDYWQYWRNTEDGDVVRFLKLFTILPLPEVTKLAALKDNEINEAKKILATEATALVHGRAAADQAAETARKTFEEGTLGRNIANLYHQSEQISTKMAWEFSALRSQQGSSRQRAMRGRQIKGGGLKDK